MEAALSSEVMASYHIITRRQNPERSWFEYSSPSKSQISQYLCMS